MPCTFFSAARGYKAGGFNLDRVQSATGFSADGAGITPVDDTSFPGEFVNSYELGMKSTLMDGNLLLNASLFHSKFTDFQLNSFLGTSYVVRSIPTLTNKGVDMDLIWQTGVEGLQVLNRRNMKWIRLDAPPGSIILNTGDYMQRISNDRLPSTTHRVSQPRQAEAMRRARVSFPLAVYVWEDEILEVLPGLGEPKYPPVSAIAFHTHTTAKYYGDDYAVDSSNTAQET